MVFGTRLREIEEGIKSSFAKIKEEFKDHLEAINENTNEINSNYEYIIELDMKIQKLNEKIEELHMMMADGKCKQNNFQGISLTLKEQEIFMLLYARNGDLIDYRDIARVLGYTEESAQRYVAGLTIKGIPIVKRYIDERTYILMDVDFRNLQAKENVVQISEKVKRELQYKKIL